MSDQCCWIITTATRQDAERLLLGRGLVIAADEEQAQQLRLQLVPLLPLSAEELTQACREAAVRFAAHGHCFQVLRQQRLVVADP